VGLDNLKETKWSALWNISADQTGFSLLCGAWSGEATFLTTTAVGWSGGWGRFGAFDFGASCGIDTPRITSATTVLDWIVVAGFVALWAWWAAWRTDWADGATDEGVCQVGQAFWACWSSTNIATFNFDASFRVDAEAETSRTVSLDNFVETENGALWNISANQAGS
jgi:hypothetical protein